MRWRGILPSLAICGALALVACGDKKKAALADRADSASMALAKDGGAEGGASASADAGVDDLALPPAINEELLARMRHLLEAITQNDPDLASDVLFPRDAYVASRDSLDPQAAWEKKVSRAFRRAVERTNKRTKGMDHAKFVGFELGQGVMQLTPKKHDFKKPLWRVKHSKLTVTIEGKIRHLDIAEMTAWRGAWYVTRLR